MLQKKFENACRVIEGWEWGKRSALVTMAYNYPYRGSGIHRNGFCRYSSQLLRLLHVTCGIPHIWILLVANRHYKRLWYVHCCCHEFFAMAYVTYQKGSSIPSQCSSYVYNSRLSQYSQFCLSNVSNLLLERDLPCIQLDHLLTKIK